MIASRVKLFGMYLLGFAGMRGEDAILSSFPRSGSTWVRFLLANLINAHEGSGQPIDFSVLNETMPALGTNNLLKAWPYSTIPRVVKTHKPYLPLFKRHRSICVVRDPRDVMVSFYHYQKDRKQKYTGSFTQFIRDPHVGLEGWLKHYTSWRNRWTLLIRYEDLKEDPFREFSRILATLHVTYPDEVVYGVINGTTLESAREAEKSALKSAKPEARFARSGQIRQWPAYFDNQDLVYYNELTTKHKLDIYID